MTDSHLCEKGLTSTSTTSTPSMVQGHKVVTDDDARQIGKRHNETLPSTTGHVDTKIMQTGLW